MSDRPKRLTLVVFTLAVDSGAGQQVVPSPRLWGWQRARRLPTAFVNLSEAFAVPQSDCYPIAKRIQKIVFSLAVLVADPKAFDLVDKVIARFTLVDCSLVEGIVSVFDTLR
ncbi:hypothetical protein [Bradyrhizobium sp. th.b2]|uniref:hypothetical protein n=1 Tax=Bradyrhizobium sp. th-b2 TaxID=172088 RepID=UPI0012ECAE85|nr:hypothetical protein [Bradyrhizobium sp. th.b2]